MQQPSSSRQRRASEIGRERGLKFNQHGEVRAIEAPKTLPRLTINLFSGGKHACIGMTFAYLQIKTIWSVLLRRFELELVGRKPEPNYATFVVGPSQPCLVRFSRKSPRAIR